MAASGVKARQTSFDIPPKSTLPRRIRGSLSSMVSSSFPGTARHMLLSSRENGLTQRQPAVVGGHAPVCGYHESARFQTTDRAFHEKTILEHAATQDQLL